MTLEDESFINTRETGSFLETVASDEFERFVDLVQKMVMFMHDNPMTWIGTFATPFRESLANNEHQEPLLRIVRESLKEIAFKKPDGSSIDTVKAALEYFNDINDRAYDLYKSGAKVNDPIASILMQKVVTSLTQGKEEGYLQKAA